MGVGMDQILYSGPAGPKSNSITHVDYFLYICLQNKYIKGNQIFVVVDWINTGTKAQLGGLALPQEYFKTANFSPLTMRKMRCILQKNSFIAYLNLRYKQVKF